LHPKKIAIEREKERQRKRERERDANAVRKSTSHKLRTGVQGKAVLWKVVGPE
jgi:hypothetical protein